jgi:hypothetical protein
MLPFGFADTFFSTLDLPTLYHTVRVTGAFPCSRPRSAAHAAVSRSQSFKDEDACILPIDQRLIAIYATHRS